MDATSTGVAVTPDGRALSYLEVGDPDGPLVIHNHGGPGSRFEARLFADAARKNRIRLVCVDRPGFGGSHPQDPRTFSGWADDLTTVADALGHREFGVTGWSEGGPWALAAAAYLGVGRLRHVTAIAPACYGAFGENSAVDHLSRTDAFGATLALRFPAGFRLMYATLGLTARRFPAGYVRQVAKVGNDFDRQILQRPDVDAAFRAESAECFAQGSAALVRDAVVLYRQWDFDVHAIERPVHLWQGLDDRFVPDPINRKVADAMPGAVWHPVAGAGHFVAVAAADEILAVAAADLGA
ncbi:alpha/beta hydrolase [Mycolicibacterium sp. S2-37]|uniref:alpha/beta fold hydrolase n=1 Tax=Mycolicibacterium sp. S2-37 TaxID=2810297 RepID=UPI001A9489C7|nr:alpha/beta hydrolase [Mycolicibacterium sp. S2-37]MBO0679438.1 alpha/beta hydrolase [Mycolicibacterium sp. S2-37]